MKYAVEMHNITKIFPGIKANDDITIQVEKGSIHALLGENGAGKSTLMSILFGLYQAEQGKILIDGNEVKITDPNIANNLGIGMVHQHFKLIDIYTVTENIILGKEPVGFLGKIDLKKARKEVLELSQKYNLNIDPDAKICDISVGMQQRVEILKMLYRSADILIFDEPTAVLTPDEITELMQIMKLLVKEGKTIILITHKLKEIKAIADVCSVLRRGKLIGSVEVAEVSEKDLATMMVGREIDFNVEKQDSKPQDIILKVNNLKVKDQRGLELVKSISFEIRAGEIVGIAGVDCNGQDELVYAITGLMEINSGEILLNGQDISKYSIKDRFDAGLAHVPADRHKHGLILDFQLKENMIIHDYNTKFSKSGILKEQMITDYTNRLITEFDVRSGQGADTLTRSMSGGNQQKAIMAREIDRSSDLLIVVQPTRGLDVGAIEYIHSRIIQERDKGKAILLVSLELDEILSISDRILVMFDGQITGEKITKLTNEKEIGLLMAGESEEKIDVKQA